MMKPDGPFGPEDLRQTLSETGSVCSGCGFVTCYYNVRIAHEKRTKHLFQNNTKIEECVLCGFRCSTDNLEALQQHILKHQEGGMQYREPGKLWQVACLVCGVHTTSLDLATHQADFGCGKSHTCTTCSCQFSSPTQLYLHRATDHELTLKPTAQRNPSNVYSDCLCGQRSGKYFSHQDLVDHFMKKHPVPEGNFRLTPLSFDLKRQGKISLGLQAPLGDFECLYCDRILVSPESMMSRHEAQLVTSVMKHEEQCHVWNVFPMTCAVCGMPWTSFSKMFGHMKLAHYEGDIQEKDNTWTPRARCLLWEEGCDKTFEREFDLSRHLSEAHPSRFGDAWPLFQCSVCFRLDHNFWTIRRCFLSHALGAKMSCMTCHTVLRGNQEHLRHKRLGCGGANKFSLSNASAGQPGGVAHWAIQVGSQLDPKILDHRSRLARIYCHKKRLLMALLAGVEDEGKMKRMREHVVGFDAHLRKCVFEADEMVTGVVEVVAMLVDFVCSGDGN